MYTVYVLKSEINGRLYIGYTRDVSIRLRRHNSGRVRSTKAYKPYSLVYSETFEDKTNARRREIFLKSGKGREFINSIVT